MNYDDDTLDLLDDDGDGVNEMCLFFDKEDDQQKSSKPPQRTGCGVVLLLMGASVISTGFFLGKFLA